MAQQLRVLAALAEELNSFTQSILGVSQLSVTSAPEKGGALFWPLYIPALMCTCTSTHIIKNKEVVLFSMLMKNNGLKRHDRKSISR